MAKDTAAGLRARTTIVMTQSEATAHHEAGRAVVAHMEGLPVHQITLLPAAGSCGQVTRGNLAYRFNVNQRATPLFHHRAGQAIRCTLAGIVAQRAFDPRSVGRYDGSAEYRMARDIASRLSGSAEIAEARLRLHWLETEAMLASNRGKLLLEALVPALMRNVTLDSDEIKAVFGDAALKAARAVGRRVKFGGLSASAKQMRKVGGRR